MSTDRKSSNNFLLQGSALAAASFVVRLIGLFYRVPLNNILGKEGMGSYSIAFDAYSLVLILSSFSIPMAVSKLVAARDALKQYKNSFLVFLCAMIFAGITGTAGMLLIYFGADYYEKISGYQGCSIPLRVLAPTVLICAILGVLRGFFQGKRTMIPTAISQIVEQVFNAVISVGAAYYLMEAYMSDVNRASYGAAGGTLGTGMGALFALFFLIFIFVLYYPQVRRQKRRDHHGQSETVGMVFGALLMTILPVVLSQGVYNLSGVLDGLLFGAMMKAQEVVASDRNSLWGIYSGEYRLLTNVPVAIATAMGSSLIPSIVAANVIGAKKDIKNKIHATVKFNMVMAIPSAVGMAVLAGPILTLLFPKSGELDAQVLTLGAVSIIFFALSTVTNAVLQGLSLLRYPVIHAAISLGIHVVLIWVLVTVFKLGIFGMVIGNITFPMVVCILNWRVIAKQVNYVQEIKTTFLIPLASAGIMGIVTFCIYKIFYLLTKSNAVSFFPAMIAAVVVYFVALIKLRGMEEEEIYGMPKGRTIVRLLRKVHLL